MNFIQEMKWMEKELFVYTNNQTANMTRNWLISPLVESHIEIYQDIITSLLQTWTK